MNGWRVPVAWTMLVVTSALAVTQVTILAMAKTPLISGEFSDDGFPVVTVAAVVASVVGALIVSRHPHHRIGWLFLVGQVGTMFGLVCQSYGYVALSEEWGPPLPAQVAMWISILTGGILALTLMALLLLLAPDGRLLSRRWRWAVWITLSGLVLHDAAVATVSPARLNAEARIEGEAGWVGLLSLVAGAAVVVGLVAGAVSLVVRTRRATGDERAQLRWIGAAAFALAVSVPVGVFFDLALGVPTWVANLPLMLGYLTVPIFTGVAILRFRLYDIDVLINRSLVLAMLTAIVAGAYVVVVVVLGHLVRPVHGGRGWTVAASVVVALGFQPMRKRVDELADKLVYGSRAAPYEALAAFSEELRAGVAAGDLLPRIAEVAGRTIGARHVSVWIDRTGAPPTVASWSGGTGNADGGTAFPVICEGERLGGITVCMARGRGLRRGERDLLGDFAGQLVPVFRTLQLEGELAAQVDELDEMGRALERSRRRLVSAQATERLRFENAIGREVLPSMHSLPASLRRLAREASAGEWPRDEVDALIEESGRALTSLRALTRGVFPAQLEHRGLVPALTTHLSGSEHELSVAEEVAGRRLPAQLEAAGYFCAVEALSAFDGAAGVSLVTTGDHLTVSVAGRPRGSFETETDHLVDRAESVGGTLLRERSREAASVTVVLPLPSHPLPEPDGAELVGVER